MIENKSPVKPDKRLAAVCGLFCPSCTIYIGTHDDPRRLENISQRFKRPVEDLRCNGCRTEQRCFYCNSVCTMAACAAQKGVTFCGECPEYPCENLKAFQAQAPHRIELWQWQARIKEAGWEKWYGEMIERFSCPSCGTINSTYDLACWKCGASPSCAYVQLHKDEIQRHLEKLTVA